MKRIIVLLVSLSLFLSSCGADIPENTPANTSAVTTKPKEEYVTPVWTEGNYVDEFNNPTGIKYMTAIFSGTFNNSATTKSKLTVVFLIDYCSYSIKLYEYGNSLVKNYYSKDKRYNITILTQDNTKVYFDGHMDASGDRIFIGKCNTYNQIFKESESELLSILNNGGKISMYIEEYNNSLTNYLFTVDLTDFNEHFAKVAEIKSSNYDKQSGDISFIRIGVTPDWEPFEYLDSEGNVTGFEVEFAKSIASIAKMNVSFVQFANFDELLPALNNNECDVVMSGMSYEESRNAQYGCTNVYFSYSISDDFTMNVVAYTRKNDVKLIENLNNSISIFKRSDEYRKLKEKYGIELLNDRFSDGG